MERVEICGLEVHARIGVSEDERGAPQRLLIDMEIEPTAGFDCMQDDILRTVDYHAVSREILELVAAKPRRLIETLCHECAALVLARHPAAKVRVRIRKFVLPDTEYVAATCELTAPQ